MADTVRTTDELLSLYGMSLTTTEGQKHAELVQAIRDMLVSLDARVDELALFAGSAAVAADVLAIPVTARFVAKTTGADAEALTLANGVAGQRLTVSLVVDGGGDGTLTPTTATGFVAVVFADAGDTVALEYVDDTVGWTILGAFGATAQPVITLS